MTRPSGASAWILVSCWAAISRRRSGSVASFGGAMPYSRIPLTAPSSLSKRLVTANARVFVHQAGLCRAPRDSDRPGLAGVEQLVEAALSESLVDAALLLHEGALVSRARDGVEDAHCDGEIRRLHAREHRRDRRVRLVVDEHLGFAHAALANFDHFEGQGARVDPESLRLARAEEERLAVLDED